MSPEEIVQAVTDLATGLSKSVYRGQAKSSWHLQSGALRRLSKAYGDSFADDENGQLKMVDRYHQDQLIAPMEVIDGATLSDLQTPVRSTASGSRDRTSGLHRISSRCFVVLLAWRSPRKMGRCSFWILETRSFPETRDQARN